jgi:hypothetical protein
VLRQKSVDEVVALSADLIKIINGEEALQLKDKVDSLQRKYNDLAAKAAELLKNGQVHNGRL